MDDNTLTAIELDKLPPPQVVEPLSFEEIFSDMLLNFRNAQPDYDQITEADPVYILLEQAAYRELNLRQRVNDAARDVMLAFAQGNNLEHLSAYWGIRREVVQAASDDPLNPLPEILEDDARLKWRTQLAPESLTTAGSVGSYKAHGLNASAAVKDISVVSPAPGAVVVTVLSSVNDGTPDAELIAIVNTALNAEDVRPLTDHVITQPAEVIHYRVEADFYFYPGPDPDVAFSLAEQEVRHYVNAHHKLGHDITLSGLYAALHQEGMQRVEITEPANPIIIEPHQSAFCLNITLNNSGTDV